MANLVKSANGVIFYDDFSERTLMWTLTPTYKTSSLEFGSQGLRMKPSDKYTIYTIVEPEIDEYSCIVELDHIPYDVNDIAGIIVLSSNKEYAECQSYMATDPSEITNHTKYYWDIQEMVDKAVEDYFQNNPGAQPPVPGTIKPSVPFVDTLYKYIKFTKSKYKYMFYASEDNKTWIEVGNVKFEDSGVIGFFIYSTEDQDLIDNSHCYFHNFTLYNGKYIKINNIDRIYEIEMLDGNGNVMWRTDSQQFDHIISRSNQVCLVNTTTLPTPMKNARLRIYDKNNYKISIGEYEMGDVYGGDEYSLIRDIRVFIDNQEVSPNELYDLGTFYNGSYFIKMAVHNFDEIAVDVNLKVIKYSEYYNGEEEIALALYDDKKPFSKLTYSKELLLESIQPSEGRIVCMKLMDMPVQDFYATANSYRFKIVIE